MFGIPFKKPYGLPFGVPFLQNGGGTPPPSMPSNWDFFWQAYESEDVDLVNGNQIELMQSLTPATTSITQSTSANQPLYIENDIVTQDTVSNQPVYDYDKIVTQDTVSNMPTWDEANGALVFSDITGSYLNFSRDISGDFDITFTCSYTAKSENKVLNFNSDNSRFLGAVSNGFRARGSLGVGYDSVYAWTINTLYKQRWVKVGNSLTFYLDDVEIETFDVTGDTFDFNRVGKQPVINGFDGSLTYLDTGFEVLNFSDSATMENDSGATPSNGDSISRAWDASAEKVVKFDANAYLLMLIPRSDWVYYFDLKVFGDAQFLSNPVLPTRLKIFKNTNNLRVTSDSGQTLNVFDASFSNAETIRVKKDGDFINIIVDGQEIAGSPLDFGGDTFTFDTLGDDGPQVDFDLREFKQWNSADDSGAPDFTLLPTDETIPSGLGASVPKWYAQEHNKFENVARFDGDSIIEDVNSANLNGTSQYFVATQQSEINSPTLLTVSYWVNPTDFSSFRMQASKHTSNPADGGFYSSIFTDGNVFFNVRGAFGNINTGTTTPLTIGVWSYIECKVTGSTHEIWVNGVLSASTTSNEVPKSNTVNLHIGNNSDGNTLLTLGSLCLPKMFNRSLSQSETEILYNNGVPLCYEDINTSITDDCVYAPRLGNWNGNNGQELIDQSASGIITTNVGATPFTGTGLSVECSAPSTAFMEGLPTITGDRTYILDLKLSTLGTTKYLLQETSGNSAVLALADNYLYLRDTTGSNDIALTSHTLTTDKSVYALVISGTNLLYYVDAVLKETVDITGRTFDWTQVGTSVDSSNGDYTQIGRYPSALDQESINYFSYERDENNVIQLDQNGNPQLGV